MRRTFISLLLLITAPVVFAQTSPPPFVIGFHGFGPEWNPNDFRQHYIQGYLSNPVTDFERYNFVGDTIFARTRELGATLISGYLDPPAVTANPNVTHQLSDQAHPTAHPQPLDIAVIDFGVDTYLKGERIMFHPEVQSDPAAGIEADFVQRGSYELVNHSNFNNIPYLDLRLSAPLTLLNPQHNAIRMEPGQGIISGLNNNRKEDLSLSRDWWPTDPDPSKNMHDMCSASGLYLLSVTVKADILSTMTESSTPLMNITITTVDSMDASTPRSFTFTLEERHFFDVNHNLITTPIEVLLGAFELRQTGFSPAVTFAVERDISQPLPNPWTPNQYWPKPWADTTLIRYERMIDPDDRIPVPRPDSLDFKFGASDLNIHGAFDLSIEYGSGSATFLLDAVCLSSPRVFGMLDPDHATFNATFPAYAAVRNNFIHRTDRLLRDGGTGILPGMRFLYGPEQGLHSSNWPVSTLAQKLLDSISGGTISLYCASAYSEPTAVSSAFNRRFTSGFYSYPIAMPKLPPPSIQHGRRPVFPGIDVNEYHDSLNQTARRGFVETTRIYRRHAELRKQGGAAFPWIPFVQNHSNLFLGNQGENWNDNDWMREPTAAELRHQCNIALANDADGVMFYTLVSCPGEFTRDQWWPETRQEWVDDSSLTGGEIDMNAGMMGYLDRNLDRRRCDWNGESKWDSTVAYIHAFLRPVADTIQQNLMWQDTKIWSIRNYHDAGDNAIVNNVLAFRQDAADPIDEEDSTFVIISEFGHRETGRDYLLVLNGRTHPVEGHRHVSVKLNPGRDPDDQWLVENVMSGDLWVVRPSVAQGGEPTSNAFTDYFPPGSAALYRLTPMELPTVDLRDTCFAHTFTVTPGAVLSMDAAAIRLTTTGALVIEDSTTFSNCAIECCDLEGHANIYVRNGGALHLHGTTLSPTLSTVSRVPISVGPLSRFTSARTIYTGIPGNDAALSVVDGHAFTLENAIDLSGGGTFVNMLGGGELLSRQDSVQGNAAFFSYGINALGGRSFIEGTRLLNLGIPLVAQSGSLIQGCDTSSPVIGRNKIRANTMAMYCQNSEIFFGERPWGTPGNWYASQNSIGVLDPTNWYHASAPSGYIYAHANYWGYGSGTPLQVCAPNVYGNVSTNYALTSDPVPFTGGTGGELSKSAFSATPPPSGIRAAVLGYLAANARADARSAMASFLQNGGGATASIQDMAFLHRMARQVDGQSLVAGILAALDNRQDLRSKLLAAAILEEEDDIPGALSVLNSYSFAGSDTLLRDALLRKAILHPQAGAGGYAHGVAVLDTLATLVAFDSTLVGFIERYPRLMSNLSRRGTTATPKSTESSRFRQALPDGIDVWPNYPNPFSDVTSFTFKLGEDRHVRLAVYDAMGREVAVVTDADYPHGVHSAVLRSSGLPSGLYFYRLTTDAGVIQRKMQLMR